MALRRPAAVAAAVVLIVEAVGVVFLNLLLGLMVDDQSMSMAGADPKVMSVGAWVAGVLFGAYLLLCALLLVRVAVRNAGARGLARILLISCAVVQGVLAAASLSLSGVGAFVFMIVSLALVVWALIGYADEPAAKAETPADPQPSAS
ncbi:hypothetical protein [Streptomyces sp. ODS28]|uniref:hypothetical protein n=1 Tax=Streptomyces sp. ODS28 TaxID=3136688 RepID=UPI0031ECFBA0